MAKRAHLKDYRLNDEGSYEYAGLRWTWSEGCDRGSLLRRAWILFAAAAGCALAAGFVPAPGTFGAFYVVVPYALLAVALVLSGVALGRLTREGMVLRDHVYQASVPALGAKLLLGAVCAAICGAGARHRVEPLHAMRRASIA